MGRSFEPPMHGVRLALLVGISLGACADVPLEGALEGPRDESTSPPIGTFASQAELAREAEHAVARARAEPAHTQCEDLEDQCFGAVGSRCGGTPSGWPVDVPPFVQLGCTGDRCWTNAGSWEHDACCAVHPRGHWCGDLTTLASTACKPAWDRAVHRVTHGLSWRREVDRCRVDDDGLVDFDEYCAPKGVIVASDDAASCCSLRTRALNIFLDFARMARQGVLVDDSFRPVVCN
ncbi:MAG: hypothetical protein ABW252_19020 [Polyangiales bacterium]